MAGAGDFFRAVAEFSLLGQQILNVFHFTIAGAASDSDVVDDVTTRLDTAYSYIENRQSDDLAAVGVHVFNLTDDMDLGFVPFDTYIGGTDNTNDVLPPGVALCVTYPTLILKTRGRKFIAGIAENNTSGGLFTTACLDDAILFAGITSTSWTGAGSGETFTWLVPRSAGGAAPIDSAVVRSIPAYQRRRKQGVGA